MYTQHPILTEKHRIVDIFADLLKKKNLNITIHQTVKQLTMILNALLASAETAFGAHVSELAQSHAPHTALTATPV